jgi:hypothetical protein
VAGRQAGKTAAFGVGGNRTDPNLRALGMADALLAEVE